MNLHISNLPLDITRQDLFELFSHYGDVRSAEVIYDRFNGYSKGFGFVLMSCKTDGERALSGLDGSLLKGQVIKVVEKPLKDNWLK